MRLGPIRSLCPRVVGGVMETIMEYALAVYSYPEERLFNFDREASEKEEKEQEKWRQSFRYSSIVPLGLKCEDYVLQNLAMDVEKDEEHEETDDEDEDEEDEPNQDNDFYDGDSDTMEANGSMQDARGVLYPDT